MSCMSAGRSARSSCGPKVAAIVTPRTMSPTEKTIVRPAKGAIRLSGVTANATISSKLALTTIRLIPDQNQTFLYHGGTGAGPRVARLRSSIPHADESVPKTMNATPSSHRGCSCTSCVTNAEESGGCCQLNRNRATSALALDVIVGCEESAADREGVCGPVMTCILLPASEGGLLARAEMAAVVALLSDLANACDASARGCATRLLAWELETGIAEGRGQGGSPPQKG